jgi:hypothetical protein
VPTGARLDIPWDVVADPAGDLYIADEENQRVRRVDHTSGLLSTAVCIADTNSSSIRRVDHATGIITAFAWNGTAA